MLISSICNQKQLESKEFQNWAVRLGEAHMHMHRKVWEWCFIVEALRERNLLSDGFSGLGFAVGEEPLTSLFCGMGCEIRATDLFLADAQASGWVATGQHAADFAKLNQQNLCRLDLFEERCRFEHVDMNDIPESLAGFDFLWSACALEHLGSIQQGEQFIYNAMKCLKPAGVAVHTTEYNFSSDDETVQEGGTVLFRKQDIKRIVKNLRAEGHAIDVDYAGGDMPSDNFIDIPPYKHDPHLKIQLDSFTVTSIALIIQKRSSKQ